ncbi:RNA 2',3'-cyclic phosphodiesterase [Paenibacillus sp. NPDC057934]|uniref:RNA 2',3'-cyclic phosphodiesterase n=1 Tax=Paenibacillus sp. NPDC057934 TaxID=3346282 RepID=UPI0036D991EA
MDLVMLVPSRYAMVVRIDMFKDNKSAAKGEMTIMNEKGSHDKERLFVAVPVPQAIRESLGNLSRSLATEVSFSKWTHLEDYHITLQFLGDTAKQDIPALIAALKKVAAATAPFELSLEDFDTFGLPASPRVLWVGLGRELEKLNALQNAVTTATLPLGFGVEDRSYTPHLTLARKYRGDVPYKAEFVEFSEVLRQKREHLSSIRHWTVDGLVLYATRMCAIPMYENVENMTFL